MPVYYPPIFSGISNLDDIGDVDAASPNHGDTIRFSTTSGKWEAQPDTTAATHIWLPLTTTNPSGDPELVWDADDALIPTFVPVG